MRVLALADAPPHRPIPDLVAALDPELILLLGDLEPAWTEGLAVAAGERTVDALDRHRPHAVEDRG